jgi:hypothetical protein
MDLYTYQIGVPPLAAFFSRHDFFFSEYISLSGFVFIDKQERRGIDSVSRTFSPGLVASSFLVIAAGDLVCDTVYLMIGHGLTEARIGAV